MKITNHLEDSFNELTKDSALMQDEEKKLKHVKQKQSHGKQLKKAHNSRDEKKREYETSEKCYQVESNSRNLTLNYQFCILDSKGSIEIEGFPLRFLKLRKSFIYDIFLNDHHRVMDFVNKRQDLDIGATLEWRVKSPRKNASKIYTVSMDDVFYRTTTADAFKKKMEDFLFSRICRGEQLVAAQWNFAFNQEILHAEDFTGFVSHLKTLKRTDKLLKNVKKLKT